MADGDRDSGRNGGDEPLARRANGNVRRLVIVESPTKARKIAGYLGSNYIVESSRGHIRDLPRAAADVPAKYKSEPWARLGVNVDADFEPLYIISPDKKSTVAELKDLLKDVDELYLATDGDREGEAIAWHLLETLKPRIPVKRMVFHEITEPAIRAAAEDPRDLDIDLVDAQETRRILDRLYGYEVSPVLWKKVAPKLSAGRVQSVATRIIVSRERERMAFRSAGYWDVTAELDASVSNAQASPPTFTAKLNSVDGRRVATGRDFDSLGGLRKPDEVLVLDESAAGALATGLRGAQLAVSSVEQKPYTRRPYAPFMTSTLQQEAGRKLRFSSERTMSIAQRLYENGYITYMRTDSTTLSGSADQRGAKPGPPALRRGVRTPAAAAVHPQGQERAGGARSHPARRRRLPDARTAAQPAGHRRVPALRADLAAHGRLADGRRPRYDAVPAHLRCCPLTGETGRVQRQRPHHHVRRLPEGVRRESSTTRPAVRPTTPRAGCRNSSRASASTPRSSPPTGTPPRPPARYTEASLIKALEDLGIGRPSTYCSIIKTIQDRGYVHKKGSALVPSWVAFAVIGLLEQHFARLVDYDFTAAMEDELDEIASGNERRTNWLNNFYFGGDHGVEDSIARSGGLKKLVGGNLEEIDARAVNSIKLFDDSEGRRGQRPRRQATARTSSGWSSVTTGRSTPQRANLKDDLTPDELTLELAEKAFRHTARGPLTGRGPGVGPRDRRQGRPVRSVCDRGAARSSRA